MKNELIKLAGQFQCYHVGIVRARVFEELRDILNKRGRVSLAENDIEKRINPFIIMPEAKSIVVCLFSYYTGEKGRISSYAHGKDYHIAVGDRLNKISSILVDRGYRAECFCDNAPLVDRYLAYLCGLGFFGKNGMLINEQLGSEFFIGYIITDCVIEEDTPMEQKLCIGCNKCIEACPGGALGDGFLFDENKCVSYITQKKGELSNSEKQLVVKSGYIWGCDKCRDMCPYNQNLLVTDIEEFKNNLILNLSVKSEMTNKEFKKAYGDRAFSWRGKGVILRNIELFNE